MLAPRITWPLGLLLAVALTAEAQEDQGGRYALLIGVKDYDPKELIPVPHAEADVKDLAAALIKGGFQPINVEIMTQSTVGARAKFLPTAANIRNRLSLLMSGRSPSDVVVVAFSGHGVQFRGETTPYFCPLDTELDRRETLISLAEVYDQLEASEAGLTLLLSDACRNDPASNVAKALKRIELESKSRPQLVEVPGGVAAFFACAEGQIAYADPDLGHGVFFHYLIDTLNDHHWIADEEGLTLPMLEARVKRRVQDHVRAKLDVVQTPDFKSKVSGLPVLLGRDRALMVDRREIALKKDPAPLKEDPAPLKKDLSTPATASFAGTRAGQERSNDNTLGIAFCWCPPTGPNGFLMGSPTEEPNRDASDELQVTARLTRGFWMGKTEVTQAQWRQVMGANPSRFASGGGEGEKVQGMTTDAFPVENVSWNEVVEFCRLLTERERNAGRLPRDWEIRLPTEAEWEYACRAGTTGATAFGDVLGSEQANFDGNNPYNGASEGVYLERTERVGSYAANAWNLHDMHGNVWEWCLDARQDKLPGGVDPLVQPRGSAPSRILRGGSWFNDGWGCRSAYRLDYDRTNRDQSVGFRLARVPRVP